MPTTVRIDEETTARLEALLAEVRQQTGTELTQQELLSRLIDEAYESREAVIEPFREVTVPLTDDEKEAMARGRITSGAETDEEDIDDTLYG